MAIKVLQFAVVMIILPNAAFAFEGSVRQVTHDAAVVTGLNVERLKPGQIVFFLRFGQEIGKGVVVSILPAAALTRITQGIVTPLLTVSTSPPSLRPWWRTAPETMVKRVCVRGDCMNGKGVEDFYFAGVGAGPAYGGQFSGGMRNGLGGASGIQFVCDEVQGTWVNDNLSGIVTIYCQSSMPAMDANTPALHGKHGAWIGRWGYEDAGLCLIGNCISGKGTIVRATGRMPFFEPWVWEGEFQNGIPWGQGTLQTRHRDTPLPLSGQFLGYFFCEAGGCLDGPGKARDSRRWLRKIEGEFRDGELSGDCSERDDTFGEEVAFSGKCVAGFWNGLGTLIIAPGQTIEKKVTGTWIQQFHLCTAGDCFAGPGVVEIYHPNTAPAQPAREDLPDGGIPFIYRGTFVDGKLAGRVTMERGLRETNGTYGSAGEGIATLHGFAWDRCESIEQGKRSDAPHALCAILRKESAAALPSRETNRGSWTLIEPLTR